MCNRRFTTYERAETAMRLMVLKRDGTRQAFDATKILAGVTAACSKRPVSEARIQGLVDEVEDQLGREYEREVTSEIIGREVAGRLLALDKVAYVRFVSVYRGFEAVDELIDEAQQVRELTEDVPGQGRLFDGAAGSQDGST